ncbi:hypothetical protein C5L38_00405 [Streptomyces sp. WAC00288]|nr:hypothetical protein C5L38_00405 [Streptomyces sp. WAC00288]
MTSDTGDRRVRTEERLRAALNARADLVTYHDLRRGVPPQGRSWGNRRIRRVSIAVLGAAAAAVAAGFLTLSPNAPQAPAPVLPASTPDTDTLAPSTPGPATSPTTSPVATSGPTSDS